MKFIALKMDDRPAKCKEKIMASIGCSNRLRGTYIVQPEPMPPWNSLCNRHITEGANSQKEKLLRRGQAISGVPTINGISQFLNPPISMGITKKKIMINPWPVTTTLYLWPSMVELPCVFNSKRRIAESAEPTRPKDNLNKRYRVPISLWLVDIHQRTNYAGERGGERVELIAARNGATPALCG